MVNMLEASLKDCACQIDYLRERFRFAMKNYFKRLYLDIPSEVADARILDFMQYVSKASMDIWKNKALEKEEFESPMTCLRLETLSLYVDALSFLSVFEYNNSVQ